MRVLIADDDREAILRLGILLRSEGHQVWSTLDSLEVAEAVREFKPQMVLLDIEMPERNGFEVAEDLCREHGSACPVLVAVTGHSTPADRVRAQKSGFHHFVAKPYDPEELLTLVALFGREVDAVQE
jgi:CheY-like chemotaxis protein